MKDSRSIKSQIILLVIGAGAMAAVILSLVSTWPQQTIVALVMTALVFLAVFKPVWSLYLMAFCLPIINWSFAFDGLLIPFIDLVALLSLVGFAARQIFIYLFERTQFSLSWPFLGSFLLFFAAVLISGIFSEDPLGSIWYGVRWILFFYAAYLWMPFNLIKDKKILKRVLVCLLMSGLMVSFIGLNALVTENFQNDFVRIKPSAIFGTYPLGENQNLIAEFLVILVFLAIALKQYTTSEQIKKWLNVIALFFATLTIGTFSRAGWIALYLQAVVYLVYHRKELIKRYFLPIIIIVMIAVPLTLYMLQFQTEINASSTASRLLLSKIALQNFVEHPIVGSGSGSYLNLVGDNIRFRAQYGEPLDSHGLWQKILAENGLLGMITFIGFAFLIFKRLFQGIAKYPAAKNILIPIVLAVSGGFVFQFFNTSYYKGKMWFPIALALAAVSLASRSKLTHEKAK